MTPTRGSNLASGLTDTLREWIVEGRFDDDTRLNEVHLAAQLEVSRTPLREALSQLQTEGFIDAIPRRGFFVRPLSLEEFRQLYRMRLLLDPAALEEAGLPSQEQIVQLEKLNERIAKSRRPTRTIALDDEWHLLLLQHCPNQIMIDLIQQFMWRTRRYEYAYLREAEHVATANQEHERILSACRRGRLEAACQALRKNMESGVEPLTQWLEARGGTA